jgi:hypothetical protein
MVKTLRILSFLLAGVAVLSVVFLVVLGLTGISDIQAFLDQKGVVESLKNQTQAAPQKEDAVSPLVTQAHKFALRIDPPPLPEPKGPATPPKDPVRTPPPKDPVRPPGPITPPQSSGRYTLLATARYEAFPERSLALLKSLSGSAKWYRQGDAFDHFEIHEIRDGSVVLYQGGKLNSELFAPKPKAQIKPLLKSEADSNGAMRPTGIASGPEGMRSAESIAPGGDVGAVATSETGSPIRISRDAARTPTAGTVDAGARIQRAITIPREPSRQEQKESIQQSISSIEEIMNRVDTEVSDEERKQEQEAWMQLLEVLRQEKVSLESAEGSDSGTPDKPSEPAPEQPDIQSTADANQPPQN